MLPAGTSGSLPTGAVALSKPVNAKKVERLRAEAKVVRAGGRLVWAEADVLADDDVVGKFASTGIRVAFDPASYIADRGKSDE